MTDLLYSAIEEELRSSIRSLLSDRVDLSRLETADPVDLKLWRTLAADLGFAGLPVPESAGGAGASWRETAVVMEELGRFAAPVPFLGSAVLATAALPADDPLLPELAAGTRTATLAVPLSTWDSPQWTVSGDLVGSVTTVADALTADVFLVPTDAGLFAVEGAARTPVVSLDLTRPVADLSFDGAPGRLVAADARPLVERALLAGAAMLASEQLGIAEWCLTATVQYAKTRRQFARAIGSYQAVKHRLADLWIAVTEARAVARYAADCLAADDPDLPVAASLAQAFCSPVAVKAAEECVQLHGGIGFTWEHPAHWYLKRARANAVALGSVAQHRARLARLVNLPG
ncbi:acyl-CoA dehydrogenase family protein [Dactylosporangium matsuzakiense]|uniref:Acyl-CoA dehydrogenase n=1 Tax=Dactylosporangium matsuzakiense TaxID=53360 RepID=A0A9W6KQJ4_9ACTN|nr:acyl-CoA dehydrogenase family protein [Dactylosporangium matsuzakiense]UWZ44846.1 acyl-CoA/acyl-ACP dehydrogenase [Dactylosporangium matsuzakiense]GLL03684.1 acyl-CoA dehydrogenase [Dactylosporangium matsuzakiense]